MQQNIIIFDGVCNFCNKAVNFIIKRDPTSKFLFAPSQSLQAQNLLDKYQLTNVTLDTLILIKNDKCFLQSDAVFEIIKDLSGYWYLFGVFKIIPKILNDKLYNFISKNRYKFFGKKNTCMIPKDEIKNRFI